MPRSRELSREIGFLVVKTVFFSLLTIISFEENTLIYYVPKFQDVCFTRSVVTAQSLGQMLGNLSQDELCGLSSELQGCL